MILLTAFKYEIIRLDWNLEHIPTLKAISGWLAFKYKRQPIMLLYKVTSTDSPYGSLVNFALAAIGVLACVALFKSESLVYISSILCLVDVNSRICLLHLQSQEIS